MQDVRHWKMRKFIGKWRISWTCCYSTFVPKAGKRKNTFWKWKGYMFQGWQRWQGWKGQRHTRNIVRKLLLYNTLSFSLTKKNNYICIVFCQHLAMDFRIFPNLSTLVNVCQRIPFHESDWYIGIYSLSTLSTPKCVHIILRRFVSKRGALNTFCHSWLLYVMSSYYDWVWK